MCSTQFARRARRAAIVVAAGGWLLAGTCDAVLQTIGLAFSIVDVWV